jgi:hypothetical protein
LHFCKEYFGLRTFVRDRDRAVEEGHYKMSKNAKLKNDEKQG